MNDCEGGADINKFKNKTFQQETQKLLRKSLMYDVRMEGFERVKNVKFASDISMELLHWLPPAECVILGKENFNFTIF